jgi:hypothetical protein
MQSEWRLQDLRSVTRWEFLPKTFIARPPLALWFVFWGSPRVNSDAPADNAYPRSLKAAVARFVDSDVDPEAFKGTIGISESSR